MHVCKKTGASLPSLVVEAHGRSRKKKSDYMGRDVRRCSYGLKASNRHIFMVGYLKLANSKHLHAALCSTGSGSSTLARQLHRRLTVRVAAALIKNGFVKPSGSSQKDGSDVYPIRTIY